MTQTAAAAPTLSAVLTLRDVAFTTKRMNVYRIRCKPSTQNELRDVFLAFTKDEDYPAPIVTATVWCDVLFRGSKVPDGKRGPFETPHYLDWVETIEPFRRQGYALELTLAIEHHLGARLTSDPVSQEGMLLNAARCRVSPSPANWTPAPKGDE